MRLLSAAAGGGGGAGAAIAAAEHAALQAEVDGGLAACVHLLHGIDLPWRPSTPWGAPVEVKRALQREGGALQPAERLQSFRRRLGIEVHRRTRVLHSTRLTLI